MKTLHRLERSMAPTRRDIAAFVSSTKEWAFPANSSISCAPTAWKLTTPGSQLDQAVACSVGGCSAPYDTLDLSQVLPNGIFSQYRRRADMAGNYLRFMQPCFTPEMFQTFEQLLKGVLGQVEFGNRTVSEDVKGVLRQVELGNSKLREVERKLTCTLSAISQLDTNLDRAVAGLSF